MRAEREELGNKNKPSSLPGGSKSRRTSMYLTQDSANHEG